MNLTQIAAKKFEISKQIENEYANISNKLSLIDKRQQDILHYMEFNKVNAVQLMKLMRNLVICRRTRRVIKIRMQKLQILKGANSLNDCGKAFEKINEPIIARNFSPKQVKDIWNTSNFFFEDMREDYENMFGKVDV